ncbi:MAG: hypothetical protein JXB49_33905 [Bacteroidales bacterium]|nr:hypothetical protein [Bacteroidales bacterium]
MKILMIGNSLSGKTTYMGSAYGLLQNSICGFTIKCSDKTDHTWLLKIHNSLLNSNKYPLATDKRNEYNFNLNFRGTPILAFKWRDFNGGVINETGKDSALLAKDIKESEGVMLFFEADALYKNQNNRTRVRKICNLLAENLESIETPFFVTIIITKFDLILQEYDGNDEIFKKIQEPFSDFYNSLSLNENIIVHVAPVSCTKEGLLHVDLPILTMLYGGLYLKFIKGYLDLNNEHKNFENLVSNSNIFESFWSALNGVPSNRSLAENKATLLQKLAKDLEILQKPIEELDNYIESYELFSSIYKVSDDIFNI